MNEENRNNTNEKPLVKTTDGLIEGFYEEGISKFYGVPYATPPIGKLRWRATINRTMAGYKKSDLIRPDGLSTDEYGRTHGPKG